MKIFAITLFAFLSLTASPDSFAKSSSYCNTALDMVENRDVEKAVAIKLRGSGTNHSATVCVNSAAGSLGWISIHLDRSKIGMEIDYHFHEKFFGYSIATEVNGARYYCSAKLSDDKDFLVRSEWESAHCARLLNDINSNSKRLERILRFSNSLVTLTDLIALRLEAEKKEMKSISKDLKNKIDEVSERMGFLI